MSSVTGNRLASLFEPRKQNNKYRPFLLQDCKKVCISVLFQKVCQG